MVTKKESYNDFVVNLTELLKKYITDDIMFITGGAQGFDPLDFWAVDNLMKKNNTCYKSEGFYSIAEVVDDSNKRPEKNNILYSS